MDNEQPVITDSDEQLHTNRSDGSQSNGKFPFPTPRFFGKQKGSGVIMHLPVSATDFLLRVFFTLILPTVIKFQSS